MHSVRGGNRSGGGVSIFVETSITYQTRNDISLDLDNVNIVAIKIAKDELNTNKDLIIITIYRPPKTQVHLFIEKLNELLQFLEKQNKIIYI